MRYASAMNFATVYEIYIVTISLQTEFAVYLTLTSNQSIVYVDTVAVIFCLFCFCLLYCWFVMIAPNLKHFCLFLFCLLS